MAGPNLAHARTVRDYLDRLSFEEYDQLGRGPRLLEGAPNRAMMQDINTDTVPEPDSGTYLAASMGDPLARDAVEMRQEVVAEREAKARKTPLAGSATEAVLRSAGTRAVDTIAAAPVLLARAARPLTGPNPVSEFSANEALARVESKVRREPLETSRERGRVTYEAHPTAMRVGEALADTAGFPVGVSGTARRAARPSAADIRAALSKQTDPSRFPLRLQGGAPRGGTVLPAAGGGYADAQRAAFEQDRQATTSELVQSAALGVGSALAMGALNRAPRMKAAPDASLSSGKIEFEPGAGDAAKRFISQDFNVDDASQVEALLGNPTKHDPNIRLQSIYGYPLNAPDGTPAGMRIASTWTTPEGSPYATINREYRIAPDGKREVYHQLFRVNPQHKGKGFGTKLIVDQIGGYDAKGFDRVTLTPEWNGRATWAKMGFELADPSLLPNVKTAFARWLVGEGVSPGVAAKIAQGRKSLSDIARFKLTDPSSVHRKVWDPELKKEVLSKDPLPIGGEAFLLSDDGPRFELSLDLNGPSGQRFREMYGLPPRAAPKPAPKPAQTPKAKSPPQPRPDPSARYAQMATQARATGDTRIEQLAIAAAGGNARARQYLDSYFGGRR